MSSSTTWTRRASNRCTKDAIQTETIAGRRVSISKERVEEDDWTFYITQPKPNILVIATHRGYLVDLLGRMDKRATTRALPADLPEWEYLDASKRLWGVRHYDKRDAKDDPSAPSDTSDSIQDPEASGLVFSFNGNGREASVTHLSRR